MDNAPDLPFADVVVNVPLTTRPGLVRPEPEGGRARSFSYSIPDALRDRVRPGHLVWVPFGARRVQGIVLARTADSPVAQTRDLYDLIDPEPLLSPQQLALSHWIARTYLAPLADAVWLFVPPGLSQKVETRLRLADAPDAVSQVEDKERALLDLMREKGEMPAVQVPASLRAQVEPLVRLGLLERRTHLSLPKTRPKRVQAVRLLLRGAEADRALQALGRHSPQALALEYLAAHPGPHAQAQLSEDIPCRPSTFATLARRGAVEVTSRRQLWSLSTEGAPWPASAGQDAFAFLDWLRAQARPVTEEEIRSAGFDLDLCKRLKTSGRLVRVQEPPMVRLVLSPEAALEQAHAARGVERLRRIVTRLELEPPDTPLWISALYASIDATLEDVKRLETAGLLRREEHEIMRDPLAGQVYTPAVPPRLTGAQQAALDEITAGLRRDAEAGPRAFLLHGVTGAGKTEIYLRACAETLAQGRQAIVLVPEIALTPQTIDRFGARFGSRIGVIHSDLSYGERYDTWRRVRQGELDIVIGPRSALFVPLPRLGLIVMDEEHEPSYKQNLDSPFLSAPLYHARLVAEEMTDQARAVLVLGSATPDVETYYRAQRGELRLLELPERIETQLPAVTAQMDHRPAPPETRRGELPPVEIVDLRAELRAGNLSILSRTLQAALRETLAAREQAILFLNRRGSATFVLCRNCGHVLKCPRCGSPLTYHSAGEALVCHHCNYRRGVPTHCPECRSTRIRYFGAGTEKLEGYVRELVPEARVMRWDRDTTKEESHADLLGAFARHEADILIGTQMIAKGLDLPRVTLVGVVSADTALHLPDFRAGERTFQLVVQVAGRAGRSALGGRVLVQTYQPEHYAIQAAARHDYAGFYETEISYRRDLGYPPFSRLVRLLYLGASEEQARRESEAMHRLLVERIRQLGLLNLDLIGPAPAFYMRVRNVWRYHLLVRGPAPHALLADLALPPGWHVDVDPVSVL